MSFLDKLASAIMPPETAEDRDNARRLAQAAAGNGDWVALVIDHHRQIEQHVSRAPARDHAAGGRGLRVGQRTRGPARRPGMVPPGPAC
ncbi:hypothetical protein [Novosphingobium sp.]|uniref:hypothetical protein n=1 Tax=Novosphingobium sp. TaxID=1874826 RepID=UPI00262C9799|nr:hypothetical protein [Novosphingobium sp.]